MEKNLIKRLSDKWADYKYAYNNHPIIKKVARFTTAALLSASIVFAASACNLFPTPDDPTKNEQNGGNNNNGNSQNNGNNNNSGGNNQQTDYSKYSKILQTVLTSDDYNDLIKTIKAGNYKDPYYNYFDREYNVAEAIPYNFLKKMGENLNDIKADDIRVGAMPYVLDEDKNTLYNRIQITYDNGDNDYIKQYLIKYDITNQEYEEIKMLYQGKYYQANLFIQELDNQREAELVSEFSIYETAYNNLIKSLNKNDNVKEIFGKYKVANFTIMSFARNEENNSNYDMSIMMINDPSSSNFVTKRNVVGMSCTVHWASSVKYTNNIIYWDLIHGGYINQEYSTGSPITCFLYNVTTNVIKDFK